MSEILGHDCDNKPLRAGDQVVPTDPKQAKETGMAPWPWTIAGTSGIRPGLIVLEDLDIYGKSRGAWPEFLRKIDHEPADEEFTADLLRKLGKGVPA